MGRGEHGQESAREEVLGRAGGAAGDQRGVGKVDGRAGAEAVVSRAVVLGAVRGRFLSDGRSGEVAEGSGEDRAWDPTDTVVVPGAGGRAVSEGAGVGRAAVSVR